MKVAIVHYRWFQGDGPERYCFNIKEILERNGHEVAEFSVKNSRNLESDYEKYFLEAIDDEVHFGEKGRIGVKKVVRSFLRMYWSPEARRKFGRFLDDVKPDIVYILQYHNKISPSILGAAKKRGIAVVHRISDFQYMCPNALFFRQGKVCEDCLKGKSMSCIKGGCVHGSKVMSALKLGAKKFHEILKVTDKIDAFVVPSSFTAGKLEEYGISKEKLNHIPTFYNPRRAPGKIEYEPFFLFVGRITEQKGVRTLVEAFADTDMPLKIIGTSTDGLAQELEESLKGRCHKIEFLGFKPFEEIVPWLEKCRATIVPSEWYDNFPNSILESFAFSKAVIASDLGSMVETVKDGETGLTFEPGSVEGLRKSVEMLYGDEELARRLGENAHRKLLEEYSAERHYETLERLFKSLI